MQKRFNLSDLVGQVPDATTLLHFRYLNEENKLGI